MTDNPWRGQDVNSETLVSYRAASMSLAHANSDRLRFTFMLVMNFERISIKYTIL